MAAKVTGPAKQHINQLQRFQSVEIHLARLMAGWLPGIERWEVKHAVGLHLWDDAQHSRDIRTRLWELRVPNPDQGIEPEMLRVIRALAAAQDDYEFLAGVMTLKADLLASYRHYMATTNPVLDAPSIPALRKIADDEEAHLAWGRQTLAELVDSGEKTRQVRRWTDYIRDVLATVGGASGQEQDATLAVLPDPPPAYHSLLPFPEARRDARFDLRLDLGLPPDEADRHGQLLWQFNNYAMEMQAAETIGSVMWETEGMPWDFYYDLARHLTDEVRHSKLGETRLGELGYHVTDFPHTAGNYAWRQLIDPAMRYLILTYVIEADSFDLKHTRYEVHLQHGDVASAQAILYDILDETMHVRFGHKWAPPLLKHLGYDRPLDELVKEARAITLRNSLSPEQRAAARQKAGVA